MELFLERKSILIIIVIIVIGFGNESFGQGSNSDFFCSDDFCIIYASELPECSREYTACAPTTGFRTFLDPQKCNCCPYCFNYLKENASCTPSTLYKPLEMCGPYLKCPSDGASNPKCRQIDTPGTCLKRRFDYFVDKENGSLRIAQFLPDCDAVGEYAPRQCLPGSLCFCVNKDGKRIFGDGLIDELMDCACARDLDSLELMGFTGRTPHCLMTGNYDELQCIGSNCFCRYDSTNSLPIQNITLLPCYEANIHNKNYTRPCEIEKGVHEYEIRSGELNNRTVLASETAQCTPDGYYARKQKKNTKWVCVDPFGVDLGYETDHPLVADQMNCMCARSNYVLTNRGSSSGQMKCCSDGNYRKYQCIMSTCFCVDSDGKQLNDIPEVHLDDIDTLSCYDEPCFDPLS